MKPALLKRLKARRAEYTRERAAANRRIRGSIKNQFSALGEFVQAFELMVAEARGACVDLITGQQGDRSLTLIALHHKALTASPIIDIFVAVYGQLTNDSKWEIEQKEKEAIVAVVDQINKDFRSLLNVRNTLLHGTWTIGHDLPSGDALHVHKYSSDKKGLKLATPPKSIKELKVLTEKCDDVGYAISMLHHNFAYTGWSEIDKVFQRKNGGWHPVVPRPKK